jgi:hypothetical protein
MFSHVAMLRRACARWWWWIVEQGLTWLGFVVTIAAASVLVAVSTQVPVETVVVSAAVVVRVSLTLDRYVTRASRRAIHRWC